MASFTILLGFLFTFSNIVQALPNPPSPSPNPIQTIYKFPNETWVENIAVRSSGQLLVTLATTPDVYQIDPFSSPTGAPSTATLIHSFPDATSTSGIVEIQPDIFAVAVGNWSTATFSTTNGSYSVWKLDLRPLKFDSNGVTTS